MTETATEAPRTRYYKFRANARAGREATGGGAFNGTCLVYEGDEFFMLIPVVKKTMPNGTVTISETRMPTWADVIGEYEVPKPPQPIESTRVAPTDVTTFSQMNRMHDAPAHILSARPPVPFNAPQPVHPSMEPATAAEHPKATDRMAKARAARKAKSASEPVTSEG